MNKFVTYRYKIPAYLADALQHEEVQFLDEVDIEMLAKIRRTIESLLNKHDGIGYGKLFGDTEYFCHNPDFGVESCYVVDCEVVIFLK